jgi:hypothetical protein
MQGKKTGLGIEISSDLLSQYDHQSGTIKNDTIEPNESTDLAEPKPWQLINSQIKVEMPSKYLDGSRVTQVPKKTILGPSDITMSYQTDLDNEINADLYENAITNRPKLDQ